MSARKLQVVSVVGLLLIVAVAGCGRSRPETVPVSGKITLNGGDWPTEATVFFGCEPAKGFPTRTGMGMVARDGTFKVSTFDNQGDGLMPGEYRAWVTCEAVVNDKTVSYVADKYQIGATSGLAITVKPGSDPIEVSWDVRGK